MPKRRQIITAGGLPLQAPALPVKVTSGKLGPAAAYANQLWKMVMAQDGVSTSDEFVSYCTVTLNQDRWSTNQVGEFLSYDATGDLILIVGKVTATQENTINKVNVPSGVNELNTVISSIDANVQNGAFLFSLWELTSASAGAQIEIRAGTYSGATYHNSAVLLQTCTQFGG